MKSMNKDRIIYSICTTDVQQVAKEEIGRKLKPKELKIIENQIGDYFNWHDSIESCLRDKIMKH